MAPRFHTASDSMNNEFWQKLVVEPRPPVKPPPLKRTIHRKRKVDAAYHHRSAFVVGYCLKM